MSTQEFRSFILVSVFGVRAQKIPTLYTLKNGAHLKKKVENSKCTAQKGSSFWLDMASLSKLQNIPLKITSLQVWKRLCFETNSTETH